MNPITKTEKTIQEWDNLFEIGKEDKVYFKVVETEKVNDWMICYFGKDAETNKEYAITTNNIRASELSNFSKGTKEDAEFLCEVLNLKYNDKFRKMTNFIKNLNL